MEMSSHALWGEIQPAANEEALFQNVDFSQMIELTMHQIPEIPSTAKPTLVDLPVDNLITHTIALHDHARQLSAILERTESAIFEGAPAESLNVPPAPKTPPITEHHRFRTPINFMDKEYCDFSLGKGPIVQPLKPEGHQNALRQCAASAIAHVGVFGSTRTTVNVLADALDHYLWTLTRLMRSVADREASGMPCGYPDIMSKVFAEMQITNLHQFYQNRVVQYKNKVQTKCNSLTHSCQSLAVPEVPPQLKMEDVPELHFPAALGEVFTPSLEPGFQMLHSLEQEELQGLELLEGVPDDMKIEIVEYSQPETSPSLSPRGKKKRK